MSSANNVEVTPQPRRRGRSLRSQSTAKKSKSNSNVTKKETNKSDSFVEGVKPLDLEEAICPICLTIKVEPVTMPCSHELCFPCFEGNVQKANLMCPLCRKRIAVWSRRAHKSKSLVNVERWKEIQEKFPDHVAARLEGRDEVSSPIEMMAITRHQLAEPGEIRKEYEAELERLQREERERALLEERASAELIAQLHEEELARGAVEEDLQARDEALARELALTERPSTRHAASNLEERNCATPTPGKRLRKMSPHLHKESTNKSMYFYLSQRNSNLHSSEHPDISSVPECSSSKSQQESGTKFTDRQAKLEGSPLHFRPIDTAPITPSKTESESKKLDGISLATPGAAKVLFPAFNNNESTDDVFLVDNMDTISPDLLAAQLELEKRLEQEKADREMARLLQKQLLQQERAAMVSRAKGSSNEYLFRRKTDAKQPTLKETLSKSNKKSI